MSKLEFSANEIAVLKKAAAEAQKAGEAERKLSSKNRESNLPRQYRF
jgi:hypothetical protein